MAQEVIRYLGIDTFAHAHDRPDLLWVTKHPVKSADAALANIARRHHGLPCK
jgi:hypothetical protein